MSKHSSDATTADLTVCTVSYHNARHLAFNWNLVAAMNRKVARIKWVVAENTPAQGHDRLDFGDPRFRVIPGTSGQQRDSYHHTEALQKTLCLVDTRFLLILDPDFYIIRPNWCDEVLKHMTASELTIFGAPWHPKYSDKYRYFPTVHCTFIDLSRLASSDLDFRPWGPDEAPAITGPRRASSLATRLWRAITLQQRRKEFRDSGTRMYFRYAKDPTVKHECLMPVYRLPEDFPSGGNPLHWRHRLVEWFLPDSLCYLPKRRGYYTNRGLREMGSSVTLPQEWEEFVWRAEPFGFHVRRNSKKEHRNEERELAVLADILREVAAKKVD